MGYGMSGGARSAGWVLARFRGAGSSLLVLTVGLLGLWAVAFAGSASALPSNCSSSAGTVTCTFASTGSEQTFTVPNGVTSVHVVAIGAGGAASIFGGAVG